MHPHHLHSSLRATGPAPAIRARSVRPSARPRPGTPPPSTPDNALAQASAKAGADMVVDLARYAAAAQGRNTLR